MKVNIEQLLDDYQIEYRSSGKNIGTDFIGVTCCSCGNETHGGITPDGRLQLCWVCGAKIGIVKFIASTLSIPYSKAKDIVNPYFSKYHSSPNLQIQEVPKIILPGSPKLGPLCISYLKDRGFDPFLLQAQYNLHDGGQTGDYKYRVIIPIYFKGELVTFVARALSTEIKLRYKNLSKIKSKIPVGGILYGGEDIDDECFLVEGIFDKFVMGSNCVATLGTVVTDIQIKLLCKLKRCVILFDNSKAARAKAGELKSILSFCGVETEIATLPDHVSDPGKLTSKEAMVIRRRYLL